MKRSYKVLLVALSLCGFAMPMAAASAAEIHVLAGESIVEPMARLAAQFEKASGNKLIFHFGTTPQLIEMMKGAEPFDLIIVPADVLKNPTARAQVIAGPSTDIAHAGLAVAIKAGNPRPDISTPEAFRQTLLQARSIATIPASATGSRVLQTLDKLGVADAVKGKLEAEGAPEQLAQAITSGRIALALFITNGLQAPGLEIVGPFPGPLQQNVVFTSTVSAASHGANLRAARAFQHYVQSPAAIPVLKANGLIPG